VSSTREAKLARDLLPVHQARAVALADTLMAHVQLRQPRRRLGGHLDRGRCGLAQ